MNVCVSQWLGFIPGTDFMRNATAGTQFLMRNIMGPLLRVTGLTRKPQEGATNVYELARHEKYKGKGISFIYLSLILNDMYLRDTHSHTHT